MELKLTTIENKKDEKFLRTPTKEVDLEKENKKELRELIKKMRRKMVEWDGVGLSANQAGINKKIFVAQIPADYGEPKFYAVINPEITKKSKETEEMNEGCLSVPGVFGPVERSLKVTLEGKNIEGKKIKIKANGFLARVFQHETDHLNGKLFIDRAKKTFRVDDNAENFEEL
jgi:peptide deformylase